MSTRSAPAAGRRPARDGISRQSGRRPESRKSQKALVYNLLSKMLRGDFGVPHERKGHRP